MMISSFKFIPLSLVLVLITTQFCGSALAQEKQKFGMQSLKPKAAAETPPTEAAKENSKTEDVPHYKPLTPLLPKEALVKTEDLEKWVHLNEAALAHSDKDIVNLVHIIESDRGAVPPQGLLLAAKSLADKQMMERAAVYYFVAQLRLTFDMARWPPAQNKDDMERRAVDNQKTQDQSAPNLDKEPLIDNPHLGIQNLASGLGQPIVGWVMKDPKRMEKILNEARQWDVSSPYAYQPNYPLTEPVAFDKWERLLEKTRETYFSHMTQLMAALEKVKK